MNSLTTAQQAVPNTAIQNAFNSDIVICVLRPVTQI